MNKYLIVDGNAVLHRAYYALPDWRNRSGEATAGVYGFLSMLLKAIEELKPTHLIIVFDTPHPTFRHNMYVGYQHNREKDRQVSEDIWGQVEKLKVVFEKMKVPVFTATGFEADDVIGTLASQITGVFLSTPSVSPPNLGGEEKGGSEVVIITGDRDLMQLVTDKIKLYMPQKGLSDNQIIDKEKVFEKLGVWPEQVVDYKALVGDTSDNYPGIPGIGPVTAKKLLAEFGNFEEVVKKAGVQKITDGYESGELSKRLAAIRTDAPITIESKQCLLPSSSIMAKVFAEMGHKSLLGRVKPSAAKATEGQEALF